MTEKPALKTDKKSDQKVQAFNIIALSTLLGFVGGIVATRLSPELFHSTSDSKTITERVVVAEGDVIANIAEKVGPSVVSINVTSVQSDYSYFYGQRSYESDSEGTGIILSSDGLIVTNKHVIPEGAKNVTVILSDGTEYEDVEIVGRDPINDIAFLQIEDAQDLTPATLADSSQVRVGERVIAIGNALGEFDTTVTSGIVSGVGRPIVAGVGQDSEQLINLFQTDASINPGNSGGPLLNIQGEVIGINTAVAGNAENIGFSIPINDVKPGITSVKNNGELIRPYLGVRYVILNSDVADELDVEVEVGALIYSEDEDAVVDDGPADKAGLKKNDIIVAVEGQKIDADHPLPNVVGSYQVGEKVTLTVLRDGKELSIEVTLEKAPERL